MSPVITSTAQNSTDFQKASFVIEAPGVRAAVVLQSPPCSAHDRVVRFCFCVLPRGVDQDDDHQNRPFVSLLLPHHLTRPDSPYNSTPTGAVAKW